MSPLRFDFGPDSSWPAAHFRPWRELVTELHDPADRAFRTLARRWPLTGGALLLHDPDRSVLRSAAAWTGDETWDGEETVPLEGAPRLRRALERRRSFRGEGALFVPLAVAGLTPGFLRLEGVADPAGGDETFLSDVAQSLALSLWRVLLSVQERRRDLHWKALSEVSLLVHQSFKPARLLEDAARRLVRHLGLDRIKIYLWDARRGAFKGAVACTPLEGARGIAGETFDPARWKGDDHAPRTWHAAPLSAAGETVGWMAVDNMVSQQEIPMDEVHLLEAAAGQLALAVRNAALFEGVETQATTDGLTKLLLGRVFHSRLEEECRRSERTKTPFAVCMLDVDKFKTINDTHGHPVGDRALMQVSRLVRELSDPGVTVGRMGGDEFALILEFPSLEASLGWMERLRARVEAEGLREGERHIRLTISAGVSAFFPQKPAAELLLAAADEAMYVAKREGRNQVRAQAPSAVAGGEG